MTVTELQPEAGWIIAANPRLAAPAPAARGLFFRTLSLASGLFGREQVPDVLTVLHINPRLFWGWLYFASRLMPFGRLPARDREKLILRTAWNCRSRYEWGQHVDIALRVGVTDGEIVALTQSPAAIADRHQRAMIEACDELCLERQVSPKTWAVLAETHDDKGLIEVLMLIGHYQMLAGVLNTAGLALEPATEAKLQIFYQRLSKV